MNKLLFGLSVLLSVCSGCSPELSATPGVSIKWAKCPSERGRTGDLLTGWTLNELGPETVVPDRDTPELRRISFVDSETRYDVIFPAHDGNGRALLASALAKTFGVTARRDVRELDVLLLVRSKETGASLRPLTPSSGNQEANMKYEERGGYSMIGKVATLKTFTFRSFPMRLLAAWIEDASSQVICDETGLAGSYDLVLSTVEPVWPESYRVTLTEALEPFGLKLVPAKRKVPAVYTEVTEPEARIVTPPLRRGYTKSSVPWYVLRDNAVNRGQ